MKRVMGMGRNGSNIISSAVGMLMDVMCLQVVSPGRVPGCFAAAVTILEGHGGGWCR
jgi:hypothetical protein